MLRTLQSVSNGHIIYHNAGLTVLTSNPSIEYDNEHSNLKFDIKDKCIYNNVYITYLAIMALNISVILYIIPYYSYNCMF